MFNKKRASLFGRDALIIDGLCDYSLEDTLECGQCFRHLKLCPTDTVPAPADAENYVEYMTVVGKYLITVGQRSRSELIFYNVADDVFDKVCVPYFSLDRDYDAIRAEIVESYPSEFLSKAAELSSGIRILRQDPWEALFSFIVSQNNNIPRIKGIIRTVCAAYGENLAKDGQRTCPKLCREMLGNTGDNAQKLDTDACLLCGACFTFPSPEDILSRPELLLPSHPGFRYRYLLDAAEKVASGEVDFDDITSHASYPYTVEALKRITGVGDKVASCAALFAFDNLEAFPIDVWMKRAINEYFGGSLEPSRLGRYAGVAQQYIFHYIRNLG